MALRFDKLVKTYTEGNKYPYTAHPIRDDPDAEEVDYSEQDCGLCKGTGKDLDDKEEDCSHCKGKGWSPNKYFPPGHRHYITGPEPD